MIINIMELISYIMLCAKSFVYINLKFNSHNSLMKEIGLVVSGL